MDRISGQTHGFTAPIFNCLSLHTRLYHEILCVGEHKALRSRNRRIQVVNLLRFTDISRGQCKQHDSEGEWDLDGSRHAANTSRRISGQQASCDEAVNNWCESIWMGMIPDVWSRRSASSLGTLI